MRHVVLLALLAAGTAACQDANAPRDDGQIPERVYSALQVDQMVLRYASSAAPVYPPELSARGTEALAVPAPARGDVGAGNQVP